MPRRKDIESILIVGAGPSSSARPVSSTTRARQACKALREEGYRVVLVNSNPATIMTDPGLADATYVEPITPEVVEKIIAREKPQALLPTMGGQTALNTAMALATSGALARHGVELIGARAEVIERAEDRLKFRDAMTAIGIESSPAVPPRIRWTRPGPRSRASVFPPSFAPPSPSAARAAELRTTRRNSSRSSAVGSMPPRPARC